MTAPTSSSTSSISNAIYQVRDKTFHSTYYAFKTVSEAIIAMTNIAIATLLYSADTITQGKCKPLADKSVAYFNAFHEHAEKTKICATGIIDYNKATQLESQRKAKEAKKTAEKVTKLARLKQFYEDAKSSLVSQAPANTPQQAPQQPLTPQTQPPEHWLSKYGKYAGKGVGNLGIMGFGGATVASLWTWNLGWSGASKTIRSVKGLVLGSVESHTAYKTLLKDVKTEIAAVKKEVKEQFGSHPAFGSLDTQNFEKAINATYSQISKASWKKLRSKVGSKNYAEQQTAVIKTECNKAFQKPLHEILETAEKDFISSLLSQLKEQFAQNTLNIHRLPDDSSNLDQIWTYTKNSFQNQMNKLSEKYLDVQDWQQKANMQTFIASSENWFTKYKANIAPERITTLIKDLGNYQITQLYTSLENTFVSAKKLLLPHETSDFNKAKKMIIQEFTDQLDQEVIKYLETTTKNQKARKHFENQINNAYCKATPKIHQLVPTTWQRRKSNANHVISTASSSTKIFFSTLWSIGSGTVTKGIATVGLGFKAGKKANDILYSVSSLPAKGAEGIGLISSSNLRTLITRTTEAGIVIGAYYYLPWNTLEVPFSTVTKSLSAIGGRASAVTQSLSSLGGHTYNILGTSATTLVQPYILGTVMAISLAYFSPTVFRGIGNRWQAYSLTKKLKTMRGIFIEAARKVKCFAIDPILTIGSWFKTSASHLAGKVKALPKPSISMPMLTLSKKQKGAVALSTLVVICLGVSWKIFDISPIDPLLFLSKKVSKVIF